MSEYYVKVQIEALIFLLCGFVGIAVIEQYV